MTEMTWIISKDHDQLYAIKFHGKPLNILPRINSKIENTSEKNKIKLIFLETIFLVLMYLYHKKLPEKQELK